MSYRAFSQYPGPNDSPDQCGPNEVFNYGWGERCVPKPAGTPCSSNSDCADYCKDALFGKTCVCQNGECAVLFGSGAPSSGGSSAPPSSGGRSGSPSGGGASSWQDDSGGEGDGSWVAPMALFGVGVLAIGYWWLKG